MACVGYCCRVQYRYHRTAICRRRYTVICYQCRNYCIHIRLSIMHHDIWQRGRQALIDVWIPPPIIRRVHRRTVVLLLHYCVLWWYYMLYCWWYRVVGIIHILVVKCTCINVHRYAMAAVGSW